MRRLGTRQGWGALLLVLAARAAAADPDWLVLDTSAGAAGAGRLFRVTAPAPPGAEIASSFDAGAEGWTVELNAPNVLDYHTSGGNPGGFIADVDSEEGPFFRFTAPASFLGDQSDKLGGSLSWDWKALGLDNSDGDFGGTALRIKGGPLASPIWLEAEAGQPKTSGWTSESIRLVAKAFGCETGCSGSSPTQAQFESVLSNVQAITIRGDWFGVQFTEDTIGGSDTTGIDNVRVAAAPDAPAPLELSAAGLLVDPLGVAVEPDGQLLVTDPHAASGAPALLRIDPATGAQSLVSSGGMLVTPFGLAVDASGDALVADPGAFGGSVIRVDPGSGAQSLVASGGSLDVPVALAVAAGGELFVVARGAFAAAGAVVRVDPANGAQTVVTSGGSLVDPVAIAIDAGGDLLVVDANAFDRRGGIVRVDPASGVQSTVASGRHFVDPAGLVIDPDGTLVVVDPDAGDEHVGKGALIRVDPATGAQTLVALGAPFRDPLALVREPDVDADGVPDVADNCPDDPNPGQGDADFDGVGDACDLACADGLDNDGDGRSDFDPLTFADPLQGSGDPGCASATSDLESPQCDDDLDNENDGKVDWNGDPEGLGDGPAEPDRQCLGKPWKDREKKQGCGLGFELAAILCFARLRLAARRALPRGLRSRASTRG